MPVESLFPQGGGGIELAAFSGWSRVLGIDTVGGSPYCYFADESRARVASRRYPDWLAVILAGVILNLLHKVGDQLRSFCQVGPPDEMGMQRFWNARKPGQRTWVGRH